MKQKKGFFATIGGWLKRNFFGGSRTLAAEMSKESLDHEEIVSPLKRIVRDYFDRKIAVIALFIVIVMLLLVIVGPLFTPNYYDAYTEVTQKNVPPTMSMRSVPKELKNDIKMIDSFGSFSVGLSNAGKVYVWGSTKLGTTGIDIKNIPEEVSNTKIAYVAAGIDHIIAISEEGKVMGWGYAKHGQFVTSDPKALAVEEIDETESLAETESEEPTELTEESEIVSDESAIEEDGAENEIVIVSSGGDNIVPMPDELVNGTIDVDNIRKVTCGYQCTAILMNDGTLYLWGNANSYQNIDKFVGKDDLVDIDFALNYIVGITENGSSVYTGKRGLYDKYRANIDQKAISSKEYLDGRKIIAIYATSNNICGELEDGSVFFAGDFPAASDPMPALHEGEKFVTLCSGTYHYSGLTTEGRVLSWGGNVLGQTKVPSKLEGTVKLYGGAFQSYAVDENDSLIDAWGLKGYIFGTDGKGADIFQRILHGGKMTMTIGAISVIISTIIGIIIGCLSGYFGGKVDMILMRVEEIFSAIPFLPFALILSAIMAQMDITENQKIFILMAILGVLTWPGLARMVRGQVLVARETEYVTAAKAMGVKEFNIAFKHILPNIVSIIFVTLTLDFATCMLTESELSYLGFGVTYPRPTWGNMLNGANNATIIKNFWWQWLFTSLFLAITCICINIVGDTLRDVMDPKSDRDK